MHTVFPGPDDNDFPKNQKERREWLCSRLDVAANWRRQSGPSIMFLSAEDEVAAYMRRHIHSVGKTKLAQQMSSMVASPPMHTPRKGFLFWHGGGKSPRKPPRSFAIGVETAVANSGLSLTLLSYGGRITLPGTESADAARFLSFADFSELLTKGVPVQILADYIRLRAVADEGGWFLDGDSVWLRAAPSLPICEPSFGHVFHAMRAHPSVPRGSTIARLRFWELKYLTQPQDQLWLASPWAFPPHSPVVVEAAHALESDIFQRPTVGYNCLMEAMASLMQRWGLECAVGPVAAASPLTPASQKQWIIATKEKLDQSLFDDTICVNNYWQSSKKGNAEAGQRPVPPSSLWAQLLAMARAGGLSDRAAAGGEVPKRKRTREQAGESQEPDAEAAPQEGHDGGSVPSDDVFLWPTVVPFLDCADFRAKWALLGKLGEGRFGEVFSAQPAASTPRSTPHGQRMAVKTAREQAKRCMGEAFMLKLFDHKNVVPVLDAFVSPWFTAIVMPAFIGNAIQLRDILHDGAMPDNVAYEVASDMAAGLNHVHSRRVLHLDLHGKNVLVTKAASPHIFVVADFGNAVHLDEGMKGTSCAAHPFMHRPPEAVFLEGATWKRAAGTTAMGRPASYVRPKSVLPLNAAVDVWAFACTVCQIGGESPLDRLMDRSRLETEADAESAAVLALIRFIGGVPDRALVAEMSRGAFFRCRAPRS